MGMKPRPRTWVAWFHNRTDSRDDEPYRVKARTREEASQLAFEAMPIGRFTMGHVYTLQEFYEWQPEWRWIWSKKR